MIAFDERPTLRRGIPSDLEGVLAVKRALPMPQGDCTQSGGFLIGCDPHAYLQLLNLGRVWILERTQEVVGFSVTLSDELLRTSSMWSRRAEINWKSNFDPAPWLNQRIGYFDQLAVLPGKSLRYWGTALALRSLLELFDEQHHALVLTTTVIEPIVNAAALSFLGRVGAQTVGTISESHVEHGNFVSAVHALEATTCHVRLAASAQPKRQAKATILELARFG